MPLHLSGAYETAYHALVHCGKVQRGELALVHGATGATGLAAVQVNWPCQTWILLNSILSSCAQPWVWMLWPLEAVKRN